MATGRQLWDASFITAPTLVLASERDFWSRTEDREHLAADLVHSATVRVVVIPVQPILFTWIGQKEGEM